jgi:phage anti-repressor protein
MQLIPVTHTQINGQMAQMVDARLLHEFLESQQDFSTWIKRRIRRYGFELESDYLLHQIVEQVPHMGSIRNVTVDQYVLTLDMAKELAMVERTPRGRQARCYFIECERQLQRLQQASFPAVKAHAIALTRAERQAINRQAWADVAGLAARSFHARREELLRQLQKQRDSDIVCLPNGFRPKWAI